MTEILPRYQDMYGDRRNDERERISSAGKNMRASTSQAIRDGVGCVNSSTHRYSDGILFEHAEGPVRLITPSWIRNEFACGLFRLKTPAENMGREGDSRGLRE